MVNYEKRFEMAYNFQDDWFDFFMPYKDMFNIVFCQACITDSENTRSGFELCKQVPSDWIQYSNHINKLKENGLPVAILMQDKEYNDLTVITKYIEELHIDAVITSCDNLAMFLKENYPQVKRIASICKCLTYKDIHEKNLDMYQEIVLDFPFERGIDAIKSLPKKYKYNIIVNNNVCVYDCKYKVKHWNNSGVFTRDESRCNAIINVVNLDYSNAIKMLQKYMLFYAKDLEYFDDVINTFKIQGREWTTEELFKSFINIINENDKRKHTLKYFNDAITDGTIKLE